MKLNYSLFAGSALASVMSLSGLAQTSAPIPDGSNGSRAPLPANRPTEYVNVTTKTANGSQPDQSSVVATHIGGPANGDVVTVGQPAAVVYVAPAPAAVVYVAPAPAPAPAILNAEAQTQLNLANNDVTDKEHALRQSIRIARNTTSAQVAADYQAYAAAVLRADTIAVDLP